MCSVYILGGNENAGQSRSVRPSTLRKATRKRACLTTKPRDEPGRRSTSRIKAEKNRAARDVKNHKEIEK
jgi:hypothetical protein